MQQGVAGIVYGRNIIHHPNPKAITRALMAVVHEGASTADALKHL
jgi:DhnA family fructose-bisphosphate aldolase class Ia